MTPRAKPIAALLREHYIDYGCGAPHERLIAAVAEVHAALAEDIAALKTQATFMTCFRCGRIIGDAAYKMFPPYGFRHALCPDEVEPAPAPEPTPGKTRGQKIVDVKCCFSDGALAGCIDREIKEACAAARAQALDEAERAVHQSWYGIVGGSASEATEAAARAVARLRDVPTKTPVAG